MNDTTFNLFVYGSLKSDGAAAHMLRECELIARATVGGILYDIDGEFTAVVLYGSEPVGGEVWRCPWPLMARLDEYERVSTGLFRRVATSVAHEKATIPCWIYVAGPKLAHKLAPGRRVLESGGKTAGERVAVGIRRANRNLRRKDSP
jgi:gamma-glutamylcyclotransferase (GGCT)/AIG2-like uncharacterized protein YtfP